jgi:hypothetical protein
MKRELLSLLEVENNFNSVITAIREGYVYISRFTDGLCVLINNKGEDKEIKGIMYNPSSKSVTRFEMTKNQFKLFYNDVILKYIDENYKIKDSQIDVIEQFDSITHALYAAKTGSYKGYRAKEVSKES